MQISYRSTYHQLRGISHVRAIEPLVTIFTKVLQNYNLLKMRGGAKRVARLECSSVAPNEINSVLIDAVLGSTAP